uniref:Platelet glycoprotein V-like n=1 Tax=Diabrotica virgifera virgifera TaxID=50390 RepID=A0A6P7H794_DIAVI
MMFVKEVLVLFLFATLDIVSGEICTNSSESGCDCRQFTNPKTHLPTYYADCRSRSLQDVPGNIEHIIHILDLSINNIQTLDPKKYSLSSENLEELSLSYNNITFIDVSFFQNLRKLKRLDLSNNFITSLDNAGVFQNLVHLVKLDLSFNNLKSLPDSIFNPLNKLTHLDLSYNYLNKFLTQSKEVLADKLGVTSNLTHLRLDGLALKELPAGYFDNLTALKGLSLADNEFELIPTVPYTLEHLDLSGNQFTFISAKYLNYHSLKSLKLNRMASLTDIHHYAFYNLFALEKLIINDCPNLHQFSELAFDVLSKDVDHHLKILSLARNGLRSLNETYKYLFVKMDHVDLSHNHWECDCDILWLQHFALEFYKPQEIRCHSPEDLKHKPVLQLEHSDLKDCYPAIYGKKSHRLLIVILSLGIVVLCGLIFFLLRYPVSSFSRSHRIGPNSPYNLASTHD